MTADDRADARPTLAGVRVMFVIYLSGIFLGLAYCIAIGLAHSGDWRTAVYSNSLLILMAVIFFGSWFAQSVTGWNDFNDLQRTHQEATVSYVGYLGEADFWEATLQNWQSEFLAVGSFAVFAIFLRQGGSPESKPVGAPHDATGVEG